MKRGYGFAVLAHPETKRVRIWLRGSKAELKPSEARGLAWTLMTMADAAEDRKTPGPKQKESNHG